jgi:NADH dehydrogenase
MSSDDAVEADVVVLGASFAGLEVVLQLRRRAPRPMRVVVVDRQRAHGYLPLVHERLSGRIAPEGSELPTATFLESLPHTRFLQGEVAGFDPAAKTVQLADGRRVTGRFIVVALGSVVTPPPSLPGAEHVQTYKFTGGFERTRSAITSLLEGGQDPRIVVVGGGISGVELAGDLAFTTRTKPAGPRVTLVTSAERLVMDLGRGVGRAVQSALTAQGVDVRTGCRVVAATAEAVSLQRGDEPTTELPCELAIWAAGVRPAPILAQLDLPRTAEGWLQVGPTLQCFSTAVPTHPDIFACGDAVRIVGGEGTWPTMQRAIECIWQAKTVAINVLKLAAVAADDPDGPPPLRPHRLRRRFFYGVSAGAKSYVVYGGLRVHVPTVTPWFRRWLMRQYFARYAPLSSPPAG